MPPRPPADALLDWYGTAARDLPWRHTTDPWHVLVSEVMLQQTQAVRVAPVYEAFVERYPTPAAMADAPLGEVLESWHGLGYPVRARRLREAARSIATEGWPQDRAGLAALPGIGPYTSAAVASFALGIPVAVADTNVRRVLSRWAGQPLAGRRLLDEADRLLPEDHQTWNQALMELGATVCRPSPDCGACPVERWCADPTVYEAPPRQSPYEGSLRQVRGDVLRLLGDGRRSIRGLANQTRHHPDRVVEAVRSLQRDGMVEMDGTTVLIVS